MGVPAGSPSGVGVEKTVHVNAEALPRLQDKHAFVTRARELLQASTPVHLDTPNEEVRVFFAHHPDMEVVVVIDDAGRPFGLINRYIFAEAYAHPFAREVYGKRSCIAWMDKDPLVVDQDATIEALVRAAVVKGPKVLKDGFIGTRDGAYAGHGNGFSLMKAMEALEAEKNRQVLESIAYASTLQRSHLRQSDLQLASALKDHFLLWEPRDVVGGDCYFFRETPAGFFGIIVDCTGHGVPGAFMSLIALSFLKFQAGAGEADPGSALTRLNRHIKEVLAQGASGEAQGSGRTSDDGMDAACFLLEAGTRVLHFAGSRIPLVILDPASGELETLEGSAPASAMWARPTTMSGAPAPLPWPRTAACW